MPPLGELTTLHSHWGGVHSRPRPRPRASGVEADIGGHEKIGGPGGGRVEVEGGGGGAEHGHDPRAGVGGLERGGGEGEGAVGVLRHGRVEGVVERGGAATWRREGAGDLVIRV